MALRLSVGAHFNHLTRVAAGQITVSDEDPLYLKANLYDGRPSQPFRFLTAGVDRTITVDLEQLGLFGNMETNDSGNVAGWIEDNGTGGDVTRTTVAGEFNAGVAGMKLASGAGAKASAYRAFTARSGERLNITAALKGDGTNPALIRVFCPETNRWLKNDLSGWHATAENVFSRSTASWAVSGPSSFLVEPFSTTMRDEVTIRVYALNLSTSATVFADDVYIWPSTDLMSVHGHTLDPLIVPAWNHSDDGSSFSLVNNATLAVPTFYQIAGTRSDKRHQRLVCTGTNTVIPEIGELAWAQVFTPTRAQEWGYELREDESDVALETPSGESWVYSRTKWPRRICRLDFNPRTHAAFEEIRDQEFRRARGRKYPLLLIPNDDRPDVLYCKLDNTWSARRQFITHYDTSLVFSEMPFASVA